jgi:uncharacterized coiled-coil protein SlyX
MSNDLVKRLRNTPNWMREGFQDWKDNVRTYDSAPFEADDRIEELEAALPEQIEWVKRLADDLNAAEGREARLKAKLAQALRALERIEVSTDTREQGAIAMATLAELKGQSDE